MDYKKLIENQDFSSPTKIADWIWNATCAITDLLARAEAAEAENAELRKNRPVYQYYTFGKRELELGAEAIELSLELSENVKILKEKLKDTEARAEAAERQIDAFSKFALGESITVSGAREVITFCGVTCNEAMDRICDYPKLKARAEKAEKALSRVQSILYEPLIIEENGVLRPVKRTSRQDVYKAILAAQKAAGVTGRWFPEWIKEE